MDVQNVTLSCDPALGYTEGNKFIATGAGAGYITASYDNAVTAVIHVNILPVDGMKIRMKEVVIDNRSDYQIEVIGVSNGNSVPITASALLWTVDDPEICEVVNGSLKALKNGTTWIHGTIGDMEDSLMVSVENPAANQIQMTPFLFDDWTMTASSQLNATLDTNNLPAQWNGEGIAVNFTFAAGRAPFIRTYNSNLQTYGLPDTIKIVLNTGEIPIDKATVYIKPNNTATTVSKVFTDFQNGENDLSIPLDEIIDVSDRSNYPLHFDNIYFQLQTAMNEGKNYTIALKEITQIYNGIPYTSIRYPQTARFSVYPNPSTGKEINIRMEDGTEQTLQVNIYSLSGQMMQAITLKTQGGTASFTRKDLQSGIYLLRIAGNKQIETVKLIVK